jgi:hypothetical protein
MAHVVASIGLVFLLLVPSTATAQGAVQLEYFIGINCILPARAAAPVDVTIGVPVTVVGTACGTTPITGAAQLAFSSSDSRAVLPPSFRFLPGVDVVLGQVVFNSPGPQTLSVQDVGNAITGVSFLLPHVVVSTPTVALFIGFGCPLAPTTLSTVTVGTPVTILGYECPALPIREINLTFTSSDPRAELPRPLVFPGGQGRVLGTVTFLTPGTQNVRGVDDAVGINALAAINVVALPLATPVNSAWAVLALIAMIAIVAAINAVGVPRRRD